MPEGLVIIGAGGFGREVLDIIEAIEATGEDLGFVGLLDDGDVDEERLEQRGAKLLGRTTDFRHVADRYVIGIGSPVAKARLAGTIDAQGGVAETLIHPAATFGAHNRIEHGCVIAAGVRVTTNVRIGRHVQLNLNVTVGHDAAIGDFASVFPGATISGQAIVLDRATVGTGANILNGVTVGAGSFVGAGAVVTQDVMACSTVGGVPARDLKP